MKKTFKITLSLEQLRTLAGDAETMLLRYDKDGEEPNAKHARIYRALVKKLRITLSHS